MGKRKEQPYFLREATIPAENRVYRYRLRLQTKHYSQGTFLEMQIKKENPPISSTLVPLVLGSSRMGMIIQVQSHQCQTEERITALSLLPTVLLMQPQDSTGLLFFFPPESCSCWAAWVSCLPIPASERQPCHSAHLTTPSLRLQIHFLSVLYHIILLIERLTELASVLIL